MSMSEVFSSLQRINGRYKIKNKRKETVRFSSNKNQFILNEAIEGMKKKGKPVRLVVLKPRQIGGTTFFGIRDLDRAIHEENQSIAIIAHLQKKAEEIFNEIIKFPWDNYLREAEKSGFSFKTSNDNKRELAWRCIGSKIIVTTDGHGVTPNILHLTEVSRMRNPQEVIGEALQGVPETGEVIQESTANGKKGYWYDLCKEARENPESVWDFVFLKWWYNEEYCLPVHEDFVATEEEKELLERFKDDGFSLGNIVFRRRKINELNGARRDGKTGFTGEMIFRQNFPMTPEDAFVTSSLSIFNVANLEKMRAEAEKISPKVTQCGNGWLKVYRNVERGKSYIVSCDPSYGEAECFSVAFVLERETGDIIAKLRGKYSPPHILAKHLLTLAKFYNHALLVVERNTGHAVLNQLEYNLEYPNVYRHREYDDDGKERRRVGFPTTPKTRSIMLSELEKIIDFRDVLIPDLETIEECLDFGDVDGKAQGVHGQDDCVMALAIGEYICGKPDSIILPENYRINKPDGV